MNRGEVIYTAGWGVGYVIACVFYIYITQDKGYTMAKYIHDFKSLGAVYILAYFWSLWLFSDIFNTFFEKYFEKNKEGWYLRAVLSIIVVTFLSAVLVKFFNFSFFPFNLAGDSFLSILLVAYSSILSPVFLGMVIVQLFVDILGLEYS